MGAGTYLAFSFPSSFCRFRGASLPFEQSDSVSTSKKFSHARDSSRSSVRFLPQMTFAYQYQRVSRKCKVQHIVMGNIRSAFVRTSFYLKTRRPLKPVGVRRSMWNESNSNIVGAKLSVFASSLSLIRKISRDRYNFSRACTAHKFTNPVELLTLPLVK